MANFYADNADLRFHMQRVGWGRFVPLLEDDFRQASEGGPSNLEEAREFHEAVLELVGDIAANVVAPTAADVDAQGCRLEGGRVHYAPATYPHLAALKEAGLFGFSIERRFGGQNLPTTLYTASVELIARGCASLMNLYALQGCGETLQAFASEELKQKYLPLLASGEASCCMSLTEANAGSALGSATCKATPIDEAKGIWSIEGSKIFSTNGGAEVLLVLARSEPGTTDARGLSLFLVPRSEKVVVTKLEEKLGIHGSPTAVVNYEGAIGHLVGERRRGLTTYVLTLIHASRLEIAAQAIGIAQAALTETLKYVRERRQFGRAIEDFAPVRQQILEMELMIEASRNLTYRTAEVLDSLHGVTRMLARHPDDPRAPTWAAEERRLERLENILTPLTKYWAAEAGNAVCYRALQLHGGYGFMRDYAVERHYRDVRITNIYEGTSEIQAGGIVHLIVSGGLDEVLAEIAGDLVMPPAGTEDEEVREHLDGGIAAIRRAAAFLREKAEDKALLQLRSRAVADMLADVVAGVQFLRHAPHDARKRLLGHAFLHQAEGRWGANLKTILEGDRTAIDAFETVVAPYRG